MDITTGSSLTEAELRAAFGDRAELAIRACNTLSKRQAHARRMGKVRSDDLATKILAAIEHYRRQLDVLPHHGRTSFLLERIELDPEKHGMVKAPDSETLKRYLDEIYAGFKQ